MSKTVRLLAMLKRRGTRLPEPLDADAHAALARCAACRLTMLCDELLATAGNGGYRAFCANAHYVEHRREEELKF